MKRVLLMMLCLSVLLTGCAGAKKHMDPSPDVSGLPSETAEMIAPDGTEPTAAPRPVSERAAALQTAEGTYIFDEPGVLTEEERTHFNAYLAQLSAERQISAAAVITDSLGGESPEAFARKYFHTLFGDGKVSGYLVLVNNDTGVDHVYAENACEAWLSDTTYPIARATPLLVEGKYADALEILLSVGEYLPEWIFDDAGVLEPEEVQELENLASGGRSAVLITTEAAGGQSAAVTEEFRRFAEEHRAACGMDALLVLDTTHGTAWIAGETDEARSSQLQSILQKQGAYQAVLDYLEN